MPEIKDVYWKDLVYYDAKIKEYIEDRARAYAKFGDSILFEELPEPSVSNVNYIYKIKDTFTTNNNFINVGRKYKGGTYVTVTNVSDCTYKYDILLAEDYQAVIDAALENYYTKDEFDVEIEHVSKTILLTLTDEINNQISTKMDDYVKSDELFGETAKTITLLGGTAEE